MTSGRLPGQLRVHDHVVDAAGHDEDLAAGDAAVAVRGADEALGDDALQRAGDHRARLRLLVGREEVDDAVDRLRGVDRVQRREHEVAGLGGGQRRVDRLLVAHLADEDDVRVLAQDAAQRALEGAGVHADLALVDDRVAVAVQELDRVLDRDDVLVHRPVHVVDHRRERGRLAGAGGAGEQDDAALLLGEAGDDRREVELLDRLDVHRDRAQDERDRSPSGGRR